MLRVLLLVSLLAPLGAAAQTAEEVQRPDVQVGDRWVYRSVSNLPNSPRRIVRDNRVSFADGKTIVTISTIVEVEGADSKIAKVRTKVAENESIWTSEWNSVADASGGVVKDHNANFSFPLQPGKVYRADFEVSRPREGSAAWRHQRTARVIGWENIAVPAGNFRALRIDIDGEWQRLDTAARGTARWVFWYVPEVKRWVRSTYEEQSGKSTIELISFEVR